MEEFVHFLSSLTFLQEFETFIAKFGDSGFVLVVLGSVVDMFQSEEVLKEMNSAFARLPHGVIWKYDSSRWPKDIKLSANVKMVDWLPQKDLLGKDHPGVLLSFNLCVSKAHQGSDI